MGGTILVKKDDGTKVRMTMEEFAVYRKQQNLWNLGTPTNKKVLDISNEELEESSEDEELTDEIEIESSQMAGRQKFAENLTSSKPEVEKEEPILEDKKDDEIAIINQVMSPKPEEDLPMVETPHELATTTPVKDIFVDEAMAKSKEKGINNKFEYNKPEIGLKPDIKKWDEEDYVSPLAEKGDDIKRMPGNGILPDQKHDLFSRVIKSLGFSVADDLQGRLRSLVLSFAKEIRTADQVMDYATRDSKDGGLGLSTAQAEELLQTIIKSNQIKSPVLQNETPKIVNVRPVASVAKPIERMKPSSQYVKGRLLHDVVAGKNPIPVFDNIEQTEVEKTSKGPIEELKEFSLQDFRRLSDDPAYAGEALLAKFIALKQESYSAYLQGLSAWYSSPLYHQYTNTLAQAINEKKVVSEFTNDDEATISKDEFLSLVETLKYIST